jgi:CDP-paratose 2-epimerase
MKHLIIGGAGFIGTNLAISLLSQKQQVTILDSLCRAGSQKNLNFLMQNFPKIKFIKADITTDQDTLNKLVSDTDRIYHLAAQVAVTTSVENPRDDFYVNALGTLNVLEAMRLFAPKKTSLIYASTNKVYGDLQKHQIIEKENRYDFKKISGVAESQNLDFHSPYGCSKGCADQYVRDYSRIYGLNTVVFRQSCIYGPHQFGIEDQGWVAWFIIALLTGKKINIYGDGKQVRDILFVTDLVNAYTLALDNIKKTRGEIFNIGGGIDSSISVYYEFRPILEKLLGKKISAKFLPWRPGDQKIYISDISKVKKIINWQPTINPTQGIEKLFVWVKDNISLFL